MKKSSPLSFCLPMALALFLLFISAASAAQLKEEIQRGAADSYVCYPVLEPGMESVSQAILQNARIPEYLQLLSTVQEGSAGLQMDYEAGFSQEDSVYLSLLFSVKGKMLQGRPSHLYYPMTLDLRTGEPVPFDALFTDPEGARAYIEACLENEVEPLLSSYLENRQLFPVPFERFYLDAWGNLILAYENSQLSFLSGYSGAVAFRSSELMDYLDLSPEGVFRQITQGTRLEDAAQFWQDIAQGSLPGLYPPVFLGVPLQEALDICRPAADSDFYPGGACVEVEEPRLRGALILTDEQEERVTGLLTGRADMGPLQTGRTTLAEAEAFLSDTAPLHMPISEALAELYHVCPGTAVLYSFPAQGLSAPCTLTLYADDSGILRFVKIAFE